MHLFLEQLAEQFNGKGITLKAITERLPQADCPATKSNLKENVWKPIQDSLFETNTTTKLSKTGEIDKIVDVINAWVVEQWKGEIACPPWPSIENK